MSYAPRTPHSLSAPEEKQRYQDLELDSKSLYANAFDTRPEFDEANLRGRSASDAFSDDFHSDHGLIRRRHIPRRFAMAHVVLAAITGAFVAMLLVLAMLRGRITAQEHHDIGSVMPPLKPVETIAFKKPSNFPIVGVVFYGRRQNVNILNCYLRKNLVTNGGYLDEVHFIYYTNELADLDWLNRTVESEPLYSQYDVAPHLNGTDGWGHREWSKAWGHMSDPDTMYIKIDDDVLWLDDDAIPNLVHSYVDNPHAYAMSAHVVNQPDSDFLNYHNGAILPFLPEDEAVLNITRPREKPKESWRISEMPTYPIKRLDPPDHFDINAPPPPSPHHRWLPLPNTYNNIHKTPVGNMEYLNPRIDKDAWRSWSIGAQQHYSLFQRLEQGGDALSVYHTGNAAGIWDMQFMRYNINFMAMWGRMVQKVKIHGADEAMITMEIPRQLGRPFLVNTKSLVAHYSFGPQHEGMERTDVRMRYRAFANERVCETPISWVP